MTFAPVALVPVYNHPRRLAAIVDALRALELDVILVDDGSEAVTARAIDAMANGGSVRCVRLPANRGKGAAVFAGLEAAHAHGYTHAMQIDADGQHDIGAVPRLLAEARAHPGALVSGQPVFDASIPRARLYGRYLTHACVWLEALSFTIRDSMCGFRVYPVNATLAVIREETVGRRMDFDTEIMVRLYWRDVAPRFIPVRVIYPEDGVSHFNVWRDNLRITAMHTRLVFGMLRRLPKLLARKWRAPRTHGGAWANIGERGSLAGMRLLAAITRLLGHRAARVLLHPVTFYFMLANRSARRASREYLARIHAHVEAHQRPATRPTLVNIYRHFHAFSQAVFEKFATWRQLDHGPHARLHGSELLQQCTDSGRGMLFFSAHLGNLDVCRAIAKRHPGVRVHALVYTQNARKFARFMHEVNPAFDEQLVLVERIGPETAIRLRALLDRGDIVVMVADRTPASGNGRVVHTGFLGTPAPFATGPYILAHLMECPVGLMFCVRGDDGVYDIHMEPFAERIRLPRGDRERALNTHAAHFAQRLAFHACAQPLQWFNFYDFWAEDGGAHQGARPHRDDDRPVEMKANG